MTVSSPGVHLNRHRIPQFVEFVLQLPLVHLLKRLEQISSILIQCDQLYVRQRKSAGVWKGRNVISANLIELGCPTGRLLLVVGLAIFFEGSDVLVRSADTQS